MPRILYIGQAPADGTGSPVILFRHLTRLTEHGWLVDILPEWGDDTRHCEKLNWNTLTLPHRRPGWLPLPISNEFTRRLAVHRWAKWLGRHISHKPDAVLCYLAWHSDLFCEIAAAYGKMWDIPVTCIIHDDATHFESSKGLEQRLRKRQARILRHNHQNWFVSHEQAADMAPKGASADVLPPLPAGFSPSPSSQWKQEFAQTPVLYYAGYLWPQQARLLRALAPLLKQEGAQLVIIGRETEEVSAMKAEGLATHMPLFPANTDALDHITRTAAGLLVSYAETSAELPWTLSSLPSKLIEYSFLGLPIALISPEDCSIMRWARKYKRPSAFAPTETDKLAAWVCRLKKRETWESLASEWQDLSRSEWAPETIHQRLEAKLLRSP